MALARPTGPSYVPLRPLRPASSSEVAAAIQRLGEVSSSSRIQGRAALQNAISRKISLESDQSSEEDREDASHGSTTSLCDSIYNPNDPVSNLIILWESKQTN